MEVHVTLTTLALFVIIFIVFLVGLLFYLYPAGKSSSIPGPNPSDAVEGNISDIRKTGSLQEYLSELHSDYGEVTAFWHGTKTIVSVSNVEHFAPRSQVFEIPEVLFEGWRPMIGDSSFIFCKGLDIFSRRDQFEFKVDTKTKQYYGNLFTKISKELVQKWSSLPEGQHVPLTQHLKGFATKAVCRMLLGDYFKDDVKVIKLHRAWEHCWTYIESLGGDKGPVSLEKDFKKNLSELTKILEEALEERFKNQKGEPVILDGILNSSESSSIPEKQLVCDAISQLTIGLIVTHSVLMWVVYFVATHSEVQNKLRKDLRKNENLEIMPETIGKIRYLQDVIKESVRCGSIFSWIGRKQDIDITIGGHIVPKDTPVIEAIGEAMQDENLFSDPSLFDPGRFSAQDKDEGKKINPLAHIPFAFGGSRKNPENSLVYLLAAILVCNITRELKIGIAGDSAQNLSDPDYSSFVSIPSKEELWATVSLAGKSATEAIGKKE
ncbi:cytochrome P450 20A1-like [Styela clava]|uniref:cytochrome P450 20A1-like n=1 Tax=Styela clava TaxID=7725 RepID=UPI001939AB33|nr:cytochrome P450 20A1-like [Styela clava]